MCRRSESITCVTVLGHRASFLHGLQETLSRRRERVVPMPGAHASPSLAASLQPARLRRTLVDRAERAFATRACESFLLGFEDTYGRRHECTAARCLHARGVLVGRVVAAAGPARRKNYGQRGRAYVRNTARASFLLCASGHSRPPPRMRRRARSNGAPAAKMWRKGLSPNMCAFTHSVLSS